MTMRVLALVSDAFGGHGGIALYNRNVLTALSAHPSAPRVTAVARLVPHPLEPLPPGLDFRAAAHGSMPRFAREVATVVARRRFDLVIVSHINLLPFGELARLVSRTPLLLFTYGLDAWVPPRLVSRAFLPRVSAVVSIRQHTIDRLRGWSGLACPTHVLENAIDLGRYGRAPRRPELVDKYGLEGRRVLLTLGRIEDPYFGFDEIIGVLPRLAEAVPNVTYLAVGGGGEIPRLKAKARDLGVADRVVFSGPVSEQDKADHYRLADAFAMPGSHPTLYDRYPLRFVFLEAMACGVPVVASRPPELHDLSQSPIPNIYVDPTDEVDLVRGLRQALEQGQGDIPAELARYHVPAFTRRLHAIVDSVMS